MPRIKQFDRPKKAAKRALLIMACIEAGQRSPTMIAEKSGASTALADYYLRMAGVRK